MTNSQALREAIKRSGYKMSYIAEYCRISRQALLNKIDGVTEFKQSEICQLRKLLCLSLEERDYIFLSEE